MTIKQIIRELETLAPPVYQESYDNAGLIVGSADDEVTGVLITLDAIEAVIDEAIELGYNLVVAHHPIVFGGMKRFNGKNYVERVVMKAIKHGIAIYAAHTNLDNMLYNGVNAKICEKLGILKPKILQPKKGILRKLQTYVPVDHAEGLRNALFAAGGGHIGQYDECSFNSLGMGTFRANEGSTPFVGEVGKRHHEAEMKVEMIFPVHVQGALLNALRAAHPYEEVAYEIFAIENAHQEIGAGMIGRLAEPMKAEDFLQLVKRNMTAGVVRYTKIHKAEVQTIAVCGGAGGFLLRDAIAQQADVFVTADYKYHEFFDAEERIIIADIGHFESEQFTSEIFYDCILNKFPNFAVRLTSVNTNPVLYA